ncbi:hypothetical protein QOZ80_9BG0714720 [Eleusine coracana subsp. coracana]|nr:hypothetical protein QOZ80_9BG0714720 [Eleusine coracana subsp. coracana]
MDGLDTWVAPPHLRSLKIQYWSWFSTLPTWINNNPPHNLSILSIAVRELRQEDLLILGKLPSLRNLDLLVDHVNLRIYGKFVVGAGSFPCLLCCRLFGFVAPVVLQQGAMPLLRTLQFGVQVREARKIAGSSGSFDFSLGNLSSLQNVYVFFQYEYASEDEVEEAIAAVRKEAEIHPNSPTLEMYNKGLRIR